MLSKLIVIDLALSIVILVTFILSWIFYWSVL